MCFIPFPSQIHIPLSFTGYCATDGGKDARFDRINVDIHIESVADKLIESCRGILLFYHIVKIGSWISIEVSFNLYWDILPEIRWYLWFLMCNNQEDVYMFVDRRDQNLHIRCPSDEEIQWHWCHRRNMCQVDQDEIWWQMHGLKKVCENVHWGWRWRYLIWMLLICLSNLIVI